MQLLEIFKSKKTSQSGFSLIELSLVLVIAGLVTGGVVLGSNLIKSSELKQVASSINQYKIAYHLFEKKYGQLAGDMVDATTYWPSCIDNGTNVCNGNGNGTISYSIGKGEGLRFWQHLSLSEIIDTNYQGNQVGGLTNEDNYPFVYNRLLRVHYWENIKDKNDIDIDIKKHVFYQFGDETEFNEPIMTQLDIKFDDGKPHSGDIWLLTDKGSLSTCLTNSVPAEYDINSTGTYDLSCVPAFMID